MNKAFEIGAYYHTLKEIDVAGIGHATFFESEEITTEALKSFQKDHPKIKISLALDKKGDKRGYERTLLAHKGMDLAKADRVALPASVNLLKSFDLKSLTAHIDLMAFDYSRPEAGCRTNFHTVLFSWEGPSIVESLQYLHLQRIDSHRISLGLSRFGIMYKKVAPGMVNSGYGQPCEGEQLAKPEMNQIDITNYLKKNASAKLFYTSFRGCFQSFIYNQENGDWISFDDELTLKSKKEWARRQKLGGVFFYG